MTHSEIRSGRTVKDQLFGIGKQTLSFLGYRYGLENFQSISPGQMELFFIFYFFSVDYTHVT